MTNIDIFGLVAAGFTSLSFAPQVYKIVRTRNTDGISLLMYTIFVSGIVMWLIYGIIINSFPVIVANGLTLILSGAVLVLKINNRGK